MRIKVQQIISCPYQGALKTVFLQSKAYELLYLQLKRFDDRLAQLKDITPYERQAIYKARDHILADLVNPPSLNILADEVGLTKMRLNHLFQAVFGDTVFGLLRKQRLACARRLLESGRKSVTEIAYECGFSNPGHLTKAFSEAFGLRPKEYQQACGNEAVIMRGPLLENSEVYRL